MMTDIKESLTRIFEEAEWMDVNTTEKALEKLEKMNHTIGYPDKYLKLDYLDSLYEEVSFVSNINRNGILSTGKLIERK